MNLRIPGPIPVPDDILEAMSGEMINHRGPEYKDLLYKVTDQVKQVFDTKSDTYILTSSGTGGMEAAIINTLSPGDRMLNATTGVFGERFGDIGRIYGAEVETLSFEYGTAVDLDKLRDTLKKDPSIKAVTVTHNETSTGVTNDLQGIGEVVKGEFDKLLLVDGISSVCSLPLQTDAWGCDVVATASQKGWMVPPGMAFMTFSERAWQAHAESKMPKYYFDMAMYKSYFDIGQPPYTPAISVMFALSLALDQILADGMGSVFEHHAAIGKFTRDGVRKLGLKVFPEESVASNTVTAVKVPDGVDSAKMLGIMRQEHNVVLAGGQGSMNGKVFRIGHMGRTSTDEIEDTLDALKKTLQKVGFSR